MAKFADGYYDIKAPPEYPGKLYRHGRILMHHYVWWQHTGTTVPKGYVIHHKNGDRGDNRLENLELMLWGDHTKLHHPKLDTVHGSPTAYTHHGCRCAICLEARRDYNRLYKQRRKKLALRLTVRQPPLKR